MKIGAHSPEGKEKAVVDRDDGSTNRFARYREGVALVGALVALAAGVINLYARLAHVERDLSTLTTCSDLSLWIERPLDRRAVLSGFRVEGRASVHEACRYVSLIARFRREGAPVYRVIDCVQVQASGFWNAQLDLDEIDVGSPLQIHARLSSRPDTCRPRMETRFPPTDGLESNFVEVEKAP